MVLQNRTGIVAKALATGKLSFLPSARQCSSSSKTHSFGTRAPVLGIWLVELLPNKFYFWL